MHVFIFELLTEVEHELLKQIAIMFRGACFLFSWVVDFCRLEFQKNNVAFQREKRPEATAKTTQMAFQIFVGRGGPKLDFC